MTQRISTCCAGLTLLLALAFHPASQAAELLARLDPQGTEISFTLGSTMHEVEGSFELARGELRLDPRNRTLAGTVVINATSAKTGNAKRDHKMHSQVLESERFPEITLTAERFDGDFSPSGKSSVTLFGKLSVHGDSHPVELPVEIEVEGEQLSVHFEMTIPYVEWGMKDPSVFVFRTAKKVDLQINGTGTLTTALDEGNAD